MNRGTVCLVVRGFEDERHTSFGGDVAQAGCHIQHEGFAFDGTGAADQGQWITSADGDGADSHRVDGHLVLSLHMSSSRVKRFTTRIKMRRNTTVLSIVRVELSSIPTSAT